MICAHCHAENTETAFFCSACGHALRLHDEVECDNHSGTNAIGICIVCGKPVCDDCSAARDNKLYCSDVAHSQLTAAHTKLGDTATEFEADLLIKNLSSNGVPALQYSTKKFSRFYSLSDGRRVSIFVGTEFIDEARRLIEEMDLDEFLIYEGGRP
jgi:hypothetical protein